MPRLFNEMAKTARMEIRADDRFLKALADLSTRTGKSRADVIRDALNFYEQSLTEWEEGNPGIKTQNNPPAKITRSPALA